MRRVDVYRPIEDAKPGVKISKPEKVDDPLPNPLQLPQEPREVPTSPQKKPEVIPVPKEPAPAARR